MYFGIEEWNFYDIDALNTLKHVVYKSKKVSCTNNELICRNFRIVYFCLIIYSAANYYITKRTFLKYSNKNILWCWLMSIYKNLYSSYRCFDHDYFLLLSLYHVNCPRRILHHYIHNTQTQLLLRYIHRSLT